MEQLKRYHPRYPNYFYGSINDWVEASTDTSKMNETHSLWYNENAQHDKKCEYPSWHGVASHDELEATLRSATYEPAIALMEKNIEHIPFLPTKKRSLVWDTFGDEIDLTKIYNGLPDYWRTTQKRTRLGQPLITLNCQIGLNSRYSAEHYLWRGVAAMNFVAFAEASGYRVQVLGSILNKKCYVNLVNNSQDNVQIVQIKAHNQPLNINALSCTLAFAGFDRHCLFQSLRTLQNLINSNLGIANPADLHEEYENYIAIDDSVYNQDTAKKWLSSVLKTLQDIREGAQRCTGT
jgi:hypothetical protein